MIASPETSRYIKEQLPEVSIEISPASDLFRCLKAFSEYTCETVRQEDYPKLKKCFLVGETLYKNGTQTVKAAVENIFVYSFSRLLHFASGNKDHIKSMIPPTLLGLYMNQVMHHGL